MGCICNFLVGERKTRLWVFGEFVVCVVPYYFLYIFILVHYHFHPFGICFFLVQIIDVLPNLIESKFYFIKIPSIFYKFVIGQLYLGRWGCHLISVVCALSVSLALCTSVMSLFLYKHISSHI